jgi:hypothetical protein
MGGGFSPAFIHRITDITTSGVLELVLTKKQSEKQSETFRMVIPDFTGFVLMCRLLDEIEKTIPAVSQIHLRCPLVTRHEFMGCLNSKGVVGEAD